MLRGIGPCVALLVTLVVGSAQANGRFPLAGQLVVDRADPRVLVARATYGLARSTDGGASWRWTCEKALGYEGVYDPPIALTSDAILAGLTDGVARSVDGACTFARSPSPPLGAQWVVDLALDGRDARHVVAITTSRGGAPEFRATLAHSYDGGETFTASPSLLPEDITPTTVDFAPSNPDRLWIAGNAAFARFGALVRTDDGGATFTETTFDLRSAFAPYVSAVDPRDPDRLWLRIDGDVRDRVVFVSENGAELADVFEGDELLGLAVSPDGARIAVGGPTDGVWVASTSDHVFTKVSGLHVRCLTWTSAGLYACGDDLADGFSVGLSHDEGRTFAPVFRRASLRPLGCALDVCAGAWPEIARAIGADPRVVLSDAGVDAADASDAEPMPSQPATASGYGCATAARGERASPWSLATLAALGAALTSRRRRGSVAPGSRSTDRSRPSP